MTPLPTAARLAHLANHPPATTYRWAREGQQVEHCCSRCRRWLPATGEHFSTNGPDNLSARCRGCWPRDARAPTAPAALATPAADLDEALRGEARCRYCHTWYALAAELWGRGARGERLHVCLTCTHTLRARAAAAGNRTRLEGAHDAV